MRGLGATLRQHRVSAFRRTLLVTEMVPDAALTEEKLRLAPRSFHEPLKNGDQEKDRHGKVRIYDKAITLE